MSSNLSVEFAAGEFQLSAIAVGSAASFSICHNNAVILQYSKVSI